MEVTITRMHPGVAYRVHIIGIHPKVDVLMMTYTAQINRILPNGRLTVMGRDELVRYCANDLVRKYRSEIRSIFDDSGLADPFGGSKLNRLPVSPEDVTSAKKQWAQMNASMRTAAAAPAPQYFTSAVYASPPEWADPPTDGPMEGPAGTTILFDDLHEPPTEEGEPDNEPDVE